MNTIAVIGANGKSGRLFVSAALKKGYRIRAGVHAMSPVLPDHEHLEIIQIDATARHDIEALLDGCDMVVSLIGHVKNSPARVQTDAMKVIVSVMKAKNISRIISLTGTGVRLPGDKPSLIDYALNFPLKLIDPDRINDGIEHVKVLQESELDWTVLRVLKLTNGEKKPYSLTEHGPGKLLVSRQEVTDAILQILNRDIFLHQAPVISYPQL